MTDQELKDLIASFAIDRKEAERERKEAERKYELERKASDAKFEREWERLNKLQEETSKQVKETSRRLDEIGIHVNGISDSNGDFAEEFFYNSLKETMKFAGVRYDSISDKFGGTRIMPDKTEKKAQFDIVLHNGNSIALIEVKYKAALKDVREMIANKVPNFRLIYPEYAKYKLYLGIGSLVLKDRVVQEAKKLGIGLMKQKGDAVEYQTKWVRAY